MVCGRHCRTPRRAACDVKLAELYSDANQLQPEARAVPDEL